MRVRMRGEGERDREMTISVRTVVARHRRFGFCRRVFALVKANERVAALILIRDATPVPKTGTMRRADD